MIVTIIVVLLSGIRFFDFYRDYHPFRIWGPLRHPMHTNYCGYCDKLQHYEVPRHFLPPLKYIAVGS